MTGDQLIQTSRASYDQELARLRDKLPKCTHCIELLLRAANSLAEDDEEITQILGEYAMLGLTAATIALAEEQLGKNKEGQ